MGGIESGQRLFAILFHTIAKAPRAIGKGGAFSPDFKRPAFREDYFWRPAPVLLAGIGKPSAWRDAIGHRNGHFKRGKLWRCRHP